MITIMRTMERGTTTAMMIGGVVAAGIAFTDDSTGDVVFGELGSGVAVSGELVPGCSSAVVSGELVVSGGSGDVVSGELVSGSGVVVSGEHVSGGSGIVKLKTVSGEQVELRL